jgi:hypothetical protein
MGGSLARSLTSPTLASASYNAANQQLAFGSQTLTYDLNGNLLGDGQNTYTWDARNRLASKTRSDSMEGTSTSMRTLGTTQSTLETRMAKTLVLL